ncbi:hypothetical protein AZ34_10535 [Hylemonella gracilis str. Niagara R]|uniref:DUF4325 domain-containing protein n=1 Tax=Hylemonella gracilis str. Niagara R TaxID=1458275 RepID=A0A016XI02_9BURK|nr:STAS-like domain-containing protein [Hylemonella gracilis]EYC51466.1 hypothetical protein AZ34_10535 [Hylemonella gracilis str. Niagara R]
MKTKMLKLSVARDFSKNPAGRYRIDGPFSGEVFREEKILPLLKEAEQIEVDLDGTEGYGSSFLDEAFAGLLREHDFTEATFLAHVVLISEDDPSCIDEILQYVKEEEERHSNKTNRPKP